MAITISSSTILMCWFKGFSYNFPTIFHDYVFEKISVLPLYRDCLDFYFFDNSSLKVTVGPNPSIIISNNLNDLLITKVKVMIMLRKIVLYFISQFDFILMCYILALQNFPNINACAALRFVLKAEISKKFGARTPAQEMQVKSTN